MLLIDAIVGQTMALIAQLAAARGVLAPLPPVERLSESGTDRPSSLSATLLSHVTDHGPATLASVLERFQNDDDATVRDVLEDLVSSGLLLQSGGGDLIVYCAAIPDDLPRGVADPKERLANLVWIGVYRFGPLSREELAEHIPARTEAIEAALARLMEDERITMDASGPKPAYSSSACVMAPGSEAGWEAAVFDHYQAMVTAICTKLALERTQATTGEHVGGSTYSYDVWPGHPVREEVLAFLQDTRSRAVALRERVLEHNRVHTTTEEQFERVLAYVGQSVIVGSEPAKKRVDEAAVSLGPPTGHGRAEFMEM